MRLPTEIEYVGPIELSPATDRVWQQSYRRCRYMRDMPDANLRQRLRDVFRNFVTISIDSKLIPVPPATPGHGYWRIRFVHTLEEIRLRFGPYPAGIGIPHGTPAFFPNPLSPRVIAAKRAFSSTRVGESILVKYGQREHIETALTRGKIRITPASQFADASHNSAIRDNELESIHWLFDASDSDIASYSNLPGFETVSIGDTLELTRATDDHYLFCLSSVFEPALFDDFECDACLIIRDPLKFRDRLMFPVHEALGTRGYGFSPVTYIDPITQSNKEIPIPFQKNARHAYQKEVRAVWLPAKSEALDVKYVELGGLSDIACMVAL